MFLLKMSKNVVRLLAYLKNSLLKELVFTELISE